MEDPQVGITVRWRASQAQEISQKAREMGISAAGLIRICVLQWLQRERELAHLDALKAALPPYEDRLARKRAAKAPQPYWLNCTRCGSDQHTDEGHPRPKALHQEPFGFGAEDE
jgi:hypothetical protein